MILSSWSKWISYWLFIEQSTGLSIIYYLKTYITYSFKVINKGITLPVTGCAGTFSIFGVLDSAGNTKDSFLAKNKKESENKQFTSFPYNIIHSKHNQVTNYFQKSIVFLSFPTRQSTNLLLGISMSRWQSSEFLLVNPR